MVILPPGLLPAAAMPFEIIASLAPQRIGPAVSDISTELRLLIARSSCFFGGGCYSLEGASDAVKGIAALMEVPRPGIDLIVS